jgi:hypothetical protein
MVVPAKKEEYEKGENLENKSKTIKKMKNRHHTKRFKDT